MGDSRTHRGPHPEDARLFHEDAVPQLRAAVDDLAWLLTRGYSTPSALKLTGDRYALKKRQRTAVFRAVCSDDQRAHRLGNLMSPTEVIGLRIDGFNVLTTVEAALGGGVLLGCRDGCLRDMASMHGNYRVVDESEVAIKLVGRFLAPLQLTEVVWWLDRPVSNSGRVAASLRRLAAENDWPWTVELVPDPDPLLAKSDACVATADSVVLDRCDRWINLARQIVTAGVPQAWMVDLAQR